MSLRYRYWKKINANTNGVQMIYRHDVTLNLSNGDIGVARPYAASANALA